MLFVLESAAFDEAKALLAPILQANPTILLIGLFASSIHSYMHRFLTEQLCLRVLCSSLDAGLKDSLAQGVQLHLSLVLEVLELFIRNHDDVPHRLLLNINQLDLQTPLLISSDHFVFNQVFVKNWTPDNPLSQAFQHRVELFSFAVVVESMVQFVQEHCSAVSVSASRPLLSLLCMLEERCVENHDEAMQTTVKNAIQSILESIPAMKTAWEAMVQSKTKEILGALDQEEEPKGDVMPACSKIAELKASTLTLDRDVFDTCIHSLLSSLLASSASVATEILGTLFEKRFLEDQEYSILTQVIDTMKQINEYDLFAKVLKVLYPHITVHLHDYCDIEKRLQSLPFFVEYQRQSSLRSSLRSSAPAALSGPIAPEQAATISFSSLLSGQGDICSMQLFSNIPDLESPILSKITRLMNQISNSNVATIAAKMYGIVPRSSWLSFAKFLTFYIKTQPVYSKLYRELVISFNDRELEDLILDSCILAANELFQEAETEVSHQNIQTLGSFIALMTISRDHALPLRRIDLKKILQDGLARNTLGCAIPFVCSVMRGCSLSTVLRSPSQPWVHMMLVELMKIHVDPAIPAKFKRYIDNMLKDFAISDEQKAAIEREAQSALQHPLRLSASQSLHLSEQPTPVIGSHNPSGLQPTPSFSTPRGSPSPKHLSRSVSYTPTPSYITSSMPSVASVPSVSPSPTPIPAHFTPYPLMPGDQSSRMSFQMPIPNMQESVLETILDTPSNLGPHRPIPVSRQLIEQYFKKIIDSTLFELQSYPLYKLVSGEPLAISSSLAAKLESFFNFKTHFPAEYRATLYNSIILSFLYSTLIKCPDLLLLQLRQLLVPTILSSMQKHFFRPPAVLLLQALQAVLANPSVSVDIGFLGTLLLKKLLLVAQLDDLLARVLHSIPAEQLEKSSVPRVVTDLIQQLMINRHVLYTNNLPKTIQIAVEISARDSAAANLVQLRNVLLQLQRRYEVLVQETVFLDPFRSVLHDWINLGSHPSEGQVIDFILDLKQRGLFQSETQTVVALRLLLLSALDYFNPGQPMLSEVASEVTISSEEFPSAVHAFVALAMALYRYTHGASKSGLLLCIMTSISSVLTDKQKDGAQPNNRVLFFMLLEIIETVLEPCHLAFASPASAPCEAALATDILRVLLYGLQRMQPSILPSSSYAWISAVSSLALIRLAKQSADETVASQYAGLLVAYLRFLDNFWTPLDELPKPLELHIQALTSLLRTLYTEWPVLLASHYAELCLHIPSQFLQLRNIITAAQPENVPQFNPRDRFSDELEKCLRKPTVDKWDTRELLGGLQLDAKFAAYGSDEGSNNAGIIAELVSIALQQVAVPSVFHAMLYEVAESIHIQYDREIVQFPLKFYEEVLKSLKEKDYNDAVYSLLDHIRYPARDTFYFCMLIKTVIENYRIESIYLLGKRLLVPGPKPWGLEFLFSQIISASEKVREEAMTGSAEMKKLVEEYTR